MASVTDRQVRRLHALLKSGKPLLVAAMRVDMDRKTARKYRDQTKLPSELETWPRTWRTREDPFADVWEEVREQLEASPGLQAKTLFEWLQRRYPGRFQDGQLRTLQRRVRHWEAISGPPKEVFFAQTHHPGRLAASDFTHMTSLGVTISGQAFNHMVYHFVLTYSNWETASICFSESFESLSDGLQQALWELGGVPQRHRTDRMSLAVNNASSTKEFTARYQALMDHYGLEMEKINGAKLMKTVTWSRVTIASKRPWTKHCSCVAAAILSTGRPMLDSCATSWTAQCRAPSAVRRGTGRAPPAPCGTAGELQASASSGPFRQHHSCGPKHVFGRQQVDR